MAYHDEVSLLFVYPLMCLIVEVDTSFAKIGTSSHWNVNANCSCIYILLLFSLLLLI